MIKNFRPKMFDDAIRAAYDLEPIMTTLKGIQTYKGHVARKFIV